MSAAPHILTLAKYLRRFGASDVQKAAVSLVGTRSDLPAYLDTPKAQKPEIGSNILPISRKLTICKYLISRLAPASPGYIDLFAKVLKYSANVHRGD